MALPTVETLNDRQHRSFRKDPGNPNQTLVAVTQVDGETGQTIGVATDFEGSPVTVGTTAVEMTFTGTTSSIMIEADVDNSGYIYVGKSNVTSDGSNSVAKLEPGASLTVELNDSSSAVYAVSDTASQTVRKLALV